MNCSKCRGMGRVYTEIFSGAVLTESCLCEASEGIRAFRKAKLAQDHIINKIRIREARERLGITG